MIVRHLKKLAALAPKHGGLSTVAFVGLGNLGSPLCARICAETDHDVRVFDADSAKTQEHARQHGGTPAEGRACPHS